MKVRASLVLVVAAACVKPAPAPVPPAARTAPAAPASRATPAFAEPQQPWAGIRFDPKSTRIDLVIQGGPAAGAGLQVGDILVSVDGVLTRSPDEAVKAIRAHAAGDRIRVVVDRGGTSITRTFALGAKPDMYELAKRELEGRPAPAFAAAQLSGPHSAKLDDLRGNVIVLDFWATWCGPCQFTMPVLERWQSTYGPKGLRVVGVSSEDLPDIQAFLAAHRFGYTIAHDVDARISQAYLVTGVPTLVVIDRTGVVRLVHLGADDLKAAEATIVRLL
ncbi:MAG TPA: redoxin domain-containing protein [Kofleriaceae bacterium]|jgi:thiol-disulfide isomerase/thioredoxin|nr:redoxin domain-containing protein [Kofleriaceae bacterium]